MKTYTVPVTTRVDATIQHKDAVALAIQLINQACDLQGATHIHEGKLCREEEYRGGSHSSWDVKVIRPATGRDIAAMQVINQILQSKP